MAEVASRETAFKVLRTAQKTLKQEKMESWFEDEDEVRVVH